MTRGDRREDNLRVDRLFGELGIPRDSTAGRRECERGMEERRRQERSEAFKGIWRGWCFGDEEWRQELLAQMSEKVGSYHCGPEVRETADARAQRRVGQELRRRKWSETDLKKRPKGDPSKVAMAQRLRAETTVTLQWIGRRLPLGTKTHLAHLLCWERGKGIVQTS